VGFHSAPCSDGVLDSRPSKFENTYSGHLLSIIGSVLASQFISTDCGI
jgi:hypothetical protein